MPFPIKQVDYEDPQDSENLVRLLGHYASLEDGGTPPDLSEIPKKLAEFPTAFSLLAFADAKQQQAVGLVNCFFGLSTFYGRRLVNIHDAVVLEEFRGRGVCGSLFSAVEAIARDHDCCRLTLEVFADNGPALRAYQKYGFTRDPSHHEVDTLFCENHW